MTIKYIKTPEALALETALAMAAIDVDFAPKRATDGSNGYDLKACITGAIKLFPGDTYKIPTGVKIWLDTKTTFLDSPDNSMLLAGLYLPRSSVKGLVLENTVGLLDDDYQGESFIKFFNRSEETVTIHPGDRIAQLVIVFSFVGDMEQVEGFEICSDRGEGGFGSTGK